MSDTTKDGGQAFPLPCVVDPVGDVYLAYPGMTLRDYFAGQALASERLTGVSPLLTAQAAYELADAMLVERAKGEGK